MGRLQLLHTLEGHSDRVWQVSWSHDCTMLASCSGDKTIWKNKSTDLEQQQWELIATLEDTHTRTVRSVAWSPNSEYLVCGSFDATISLWYFSLKRMDWECYTTLEGHESEVKSVAWESTGKFLASCSRDKSVWIWEGLGSDFECLAVLNGHSQDVKSVVWHPSKPILASTSYDDTVRIWQEDKGEDDWVCTDILKGHTSTVWESKFSPTGLHLATVADDRNLIIWKHFDKDNIGQEVIPDEKEHMWKNVCTISGAHTRTIYSVDWSSNDRIATGCSDNAIRIFSSASPTGFQVEDPAPNFVLDCTMEQAHIADVNCVRWSHKVANVLASTGDDNVIKIWKYVPDE